MAAAYQLSIQQALEKALCLHNVPGVQPQHPEIEFPSHPDFKLDTVLVEKNAQECCFIEPTINSARISLKVKQRDELERWLTKKWIELLTQASYAEVFQDVHDQILTTGLISLSGLGLQECRDRPLRRMTRIPYNP